MVFFLVELQSEVFFLALQPLQLSRELVGVVTLIGWVCQKHQDGRWSLSSKQVYSLCRVVLNFPIHPKFAKPEDPPLHQPLSSSDDLTPSLSSFHAYKVPASQGHLISFVLATLWQCHHFVLQQKRDLGPRWSGPALPEASAMFEDFSDCLDTAQFDIDVVFHSLSCLVPEVKRTLEKNCSHVHVMCREIVADITPLKCRICMV